MTCYIMQLSLIAPGVPEKHPSPEAELAAGRPCSGPSQVLCAGEVDVLSGGSFLVQPAFVPIYLQWTLCMVSVCFVHLAQYAVRIQLAFVEFKMVSVC